MDPLVKITTVYAESVYALYKSKKYGMKTCDMTIDPQYAYNLLNLYTSSLEMNSCGVNIVGCSLETLTELINTL